MTTDTSLSFAEFGLSEAVLQAVLRKGFTAPSSIQALALPRLLADEGHLVAKARTGTGKTAAFGIPLVERLSVKSDAPQALILTPTRELALQVSQEIRSLAGGPFPRIAAVYGGASIGPQLRDLSRGVEIVVGTPGRVMDHLERGSLDLSNIQWFVLDEADEMLDMGFFEDVESILSKSNPDRRVALFSATMSDPILRVIKKYIGPVDIVEDEAVEDEKPAVDQFYMVIRKEDRLEALRRVIDSTDDFYGLVFCGTKVETDEVARRLVEGGYPAEAIHGDLSQEARERTLRRFRSKMTTILVATDVAARGIDVERLTHVINWDFPNDRELYVHRIGRTGRAGRKGTAITFVLPPFRGRMVQLSRSMEKILGSPIVNKNVPPVAQVMDAIRRRVLVSALGSAPGQEEDTVTGIGEAVPAETFGSDDPRSQLAGELIEKLGERRAVEALVSAAYGTILDPSRYGNIVTVSDRPERPASGRFEGGFSRSNRFERPQRERDTGRRGAGGGDRVYIGLGRRHGASARDVAGLLMRAGGVPGRLVDSIEMREFCAFATIPAEAARRAYEFARRDPDHPAIKPADPAEGRSPKKY
jgi:ATP-dependent RNA helicase DeaD